MRLGERLYGWLLRVFPREFRQRHAAGMAEEFARQRAAVRGRPLGVAWLWVRSVADICWHGLSVRRDDRRARSRPASHGGPIPAAWLSALGHDTRQAARALARAPGVSLAVIVILTLGISANAIMFGTIDQLLLRGPAGIGHPDDVRRIYFGYEKEPAPGAQASDRHSYRFVAAIRDDVPAFRQGAALHRADVTVGAGPEASRARVDLVDAAYFPLLELRPALGRFFTSGESPLTDTAPVVVLSHAYWRRNFGADASVLGRSLLVEGRRLTILGVGPAEFTGLEDEAVDFWTPIGALAPALLPKGWDTHESWFAFGLAVRLSPGVSDVVANEQATAAYRRATTGLKTVAPGGVAIAVPLARVASPNGIMPLGQVGLWLVAVSGIVLLVAVANVATLLMTRTLSRRREIAVRLALGMSRGRLLRMIMTESALLAGLAAAASLAVAWAGAHVVQQVLLPGFAWSSSVIDTRVFLVTLGVGVLTAFGAGLPPVLHAGSTDLQAHVRTKGAGNARRFSRFGTGMVTAQVALCALLLVGGGLFLRSLVTLGALDVGIDLEQVIKVQMPRQTGEATSEQEALYAEARARIGAMPGTSRTSLARGSAPMAGASGYTVMPDGWDLTMIKGQPAPFFMAVDDEFFPTLGAGFDRGRGLTPLEIKDQARVAVVNRALAARFWPNVDAVGQCLRFGVGGSGPCTRIVGVVENTLLFSRDRVTNASPQLFVPFTHPDIREAEPRALLVRTESDAEALVPAVRSLVQSLSPGMPFVAVDTLAAITAPQLQPWRLGTTMFLLFGGVALVIAAVGLYSTMATAVVQRSHEVGIRLALGATRTHVAGEVVRRTFVTVLGGLALGLLASLAAAPWVATLLFQTSPRDPIVYGTAAAVLVAAALGAAVVPIRRSVAIDPLRVLKAE